jgi:hypothetical protein
VISEFQFWHGLSIPDGLVEGACQNLPLPPRQVTELAIDASALRIE